MSMWGKIEVCYLFNSELCVCSIMYLFMPLAIESFSCTIRICMEKPVLGEVARRSVATHTFFFTVASQHVPPLVVFLLPRWGGDGKNTVSPFLQMRGSLKFYATSLTADVSDHHSPVLNSEA